MSCNKCSNYSQIVYNVLHGQMNQFQPLQCPFKIKWDLSAPTPSRQSTGILSSCIPLSLSLSFQQVPVSISTLPVSI